MRKDAQAVLLLLIGGTLLKISFAGTYLRYVKPGHLPLLVGAGVVLVVIATAALWQTLRRPRHAVPAMASGQVDIEPVGGLVPLQPDVELGGERDSAPHPDYPRHVDRSEHVHGESRVGWLLLVPALALLMFAPPALGAFQAGRNGTALQASASSDFAPLPAGDPVRISLLDYASRAVFDHGQSLLNRQVKLSGFIIAGPNGEPYLARMIVTCCAADARPVKVGLSGDLSTTVGPEQWVEVIGTYTERSDKDSVNGELIPYLNVVSSRAIEAPNVQYES